MTTKSEIFVTITEAAIDRANHDVDTGEVIWDHVLEDVKFCYRDEIKRDASVEVAVVDSLFAFRRKFERA